MERTEVRFVEDASAVLAQDLEGHDRILVVCAPSRRFVDEIRTALEFAEVEVFDGARVHVPKGTVAEASAIVQAFRPSAIVSVGGGAATGLVKMLRLQHDFRFVALPSTYAGSEMTTIYGSTHERQKTTGRDERVGPDLVLYDPSLAAAMPLDLTIKSLFNALAHPISSLSAGGEREEAESAISDLVEAAVQLVQFPQNREARMLALQGVAAAGRVLEAGRLGLHHELAHALGGRFDVEHAGLHAVLLPHSLLRLQKEDPGTYDRVERAAGLIDMPHQLLQLLKRAGAPTGLRQLGIDWSDFITALEQVDPSSKDILIPAHQGRVRRAGTRWVPELGAGDERVSVRGDLEQADRIVLALHGRGADADSIIQMGTEIAGLSGDIAWLAPQADNNAWYTNSYRDEPATIGVPLDAALSRVERLLRQARQTNPDARVLIFGFSQGACLGLEAAARTELPLDGVVAIAGARIGPSSGYGRPTARIEGVPVLLGVADGDPWVDKKDVEATAEHLRAAGAQVQLLGAAGELHQIDEAQRLAGAELLTGRRFGSGPTGFGNFVQSEALPGALPGRGNSPRPAPYGLHAEQVNGTRFVEDRKDNLRIWTYRHRPSAIHSAFRPVEAPRLAGSFEAEPDPSLQGWAPLSMPDAPTDFVEGLVTVAGAGGAREGRGCALHFYAANRSMDRRAFSNADGDLLLVPQQGGLTLRTELGVLRVNPGQIALLPRGLRFSVLLDQGQARGYAAEVFHGHFELPERGPIGANGLTEARHFRAPEAWGEDRLALGFRLAHKFAGRLFEATQDYSPFDVVAWHGNYAPYVYDLMDFSPVSNARFDHPDPSIYTVLSARMGAEGALDFVFFPPRWDPSEDTFRPPFLHRNGVTEFNGIIRDPSGDEAPFYAGGAFLTPGMTSHTVRSRGVLRAIMEGHNEPSRTRESSMWFQFESSIPLSTTPWAAAHRLKAWPHYWAGQRSFFHPQP
ncbi:MAG: iron-containing alcohol dehydrogenase [Myxococcota bacterium]